MSAEVKTKPEAVGYMLGQALYIAPVVYVIITRHVATWVWWCFAVQFTLFVFNTLYQQAKQK